MSSVVRVSSDHASSWSGTAATPTHDGRPGGRPPALRSRAGGGYRSNIPRNPISIHWCIFSLWIEPKSDRSPES